MLFGRAIALRFGYNYFRQKELALENKNGIVGFSFGGGIRVRAFHLDYVPAEELKLMWLTVSNWIVAFRLV